MPTGRRRKRRNNIYEKYEFNFFMTEAPTI